MWTILWMMLSVSALVADLTGLIIPQWSLVQRDNTNNRSRRDLIGQSRDWTEREGDATTPSNRTQKERRDGGTIFLDSGSRTTDDVSSKDYNNIDRRQVGLWKWCSTVGNNTKYTCTTWNEADVPGKVGVRLKMFAILFVIKQISKVLSVIAITMLNT